MKVDENILNLIAETNPGNYAVFSLYNGIIKGIMCSKELHKLSGMTAEGYDKLANQNAAEIILENDISYVTALLSEQVTDGKDCELTFRIKHKTKGAVWVHANSRLIGEMDGKPVIIVTFQNTSGEAEGQSCLLNSTETLVYVIDKRNHELLFANEAALKFWNIRNYSGKKCYEIISQRKSECIGCPVKMIKNGSYVQDELFNPEHRKWFKIFCNDIDWHGRQAASVFAYDITSEINRRHNIELDKKSLETFIENIPIGIGVCFIKDSKITTGTVNKVMADMLGSDTNELSLADCSFIDRVHPNDIDNLIKAMKNSSKANISAKIDFRYRVTPDSEYHWYRRMLHTKKIDGGTAAFVCLIDVTAEKSSSIEAEKGRQIYNTAATVGKLLVWEYDIHTHNINMKTDSEYTRQICQKFGIPDKVSNNLKLLDKMTSEQCRNSYINMYKQIDDGAKEATCEFEISTYRGIAYWCISLTSVQDADGKVLTVYGIGHDITVQHLEEEQFRNAFQELMTEGYDTIGTFRHNITANQTRDGRGKYSESFAKAAIGTVDEHIAAMASLIDDEADRKRFISYFSRDNLIKNFNEGRTKASYETLLRFPDGKRHWVSGAFNMMRNPVTGDVEAVSLASDVTEAKRLKKIAALVTVGEFDYVGVIDIVTKQFEIYSKKPEIKFIGIHQKISYSYGVNYILEKYIAPNDREQYILTMDLNRIISALNECGRYEASYLRTDKGLVTRHQVRCTWLDKENEEILIVRTNITEAYMQEQRRLETVQNALSQAERANAAKTDFLSRMSHDLRTPLNGIIGLSDIATAEKLSEEEIRQYLSEINSAGKYLLGIINDVLDMSKIDSRKIVFHPEIFSFEEFCGTLRNVIDIQCAAKKQNFTIVPPDGEFAHYIVVDKTRFFQIFLNLLTNSVKYTPEGGKIELIVEHLSRDENKIKKRFTVRDNGIGMSMEFVRRAFEPFAQENEFDTQSGTGLGLSIVKNLVELMGGTIQIKSEKNKGTSVIIEIVLEAVDKAEISGNDKFEKYDFSGKNFLLCEDNEINAKIATKLLNKVGAEIEYAQNGKIAVEAFRKSTINYFDAILMDIRMPVMDGIEAAKEIRQLERADAEFVPIIALTANAFDDDRDECFEAGMNGHIAKPIEPNVLYSAVFEAMTNRNKK